MAAVNDYFRTLVERFGQGWNRFWFTPSDPLPLGVVRVLTALVALGVYLTYLPDLDQFFGPDGLLSRDFVLQLRGNVPVFSMFDYAQTSGELHAFFWLGATAIGLLLTGLFTRVTSVLALVAMLSIVDRGPVLARPVDDILAMLMFYLCLGPCGRTLSLDAWLRRLRAGSREAAVLEAAAPTPSWGATVSLRLMQVHLAAIYGAMAVAKMKGSVWWDGTAVWGLIARPESRLVDLTAMASPHFDYLVNSWTHSIVAFELCFALLIWNRLARPLLLALALPIWIGTALLTGMVSFALVMLVANLAFVSPATFRCCFATRSASGTS